MFLFEDGTVVVVKFMQLSLVDREEGQTFMCTSCY